MFEIIHVLQHWTRVRRRLGMHLRTQAMSGIVGKWQLGGDAKTIQSLGLRTLPLAYSRCSERAICEPNAFDEWCINRVSGGVWSRHTAGLCGAFHPTARRSAFFPLLSNDSPHYPFQPTPDSSDWDPTLDPYFNDTKYFGEMVAYMDKLVGDLIDVVDEVGLSKTL